MILDLALWGTALSFLAIVGGLLVDRTEIGAGLAEAVKGRPYVLTTEEKS